MQWTDSGSVIASLFRSSINPILTASHSVQFHIGLFLFEAGCRTWCSLSNRAQTNSISQYLWLSWLRSIIRPSLHHLLTICPSFQVCHMRMSSSAYLPPFTPPLHCGWYDLLVKYFCSWFWIHFALNSGERRIILYFALPFSDKWKSFGDKGNVKQHKNYLAIYEK